MSADTRREWREDALAAAVLGSRSELRLAKHLLACMDALESAEAALADASARNQWLGDAS